MTQVRLCIREIYNVVYLKCTDPAYISSIVQSIQYRITNYLHSVRQAVKGEYSGVTASFRHWVNRTKKFELLNCAELELTEVLCLPVKAKVSKSRKLHLHACQTGSVYG